MNRLTWIPAISWMVSLCTGVLAFGQEKSPSALAREPETVLATFRVKERKEDVFARVLARHWPTCRRLGLVLDQPHLVLRGSDEPGRTYFVEILTWKSHDVPDNVPAEVRAIWDEMQALCEKRQGHSGIEIDEVQISDLKN